MLLNSQQPKNRKRKTRIEYIIFYHIKMIKTIINTAMSPTKVNIMEHWRFCHWLR